MFLEQPLCFQNNACAYDHHFAMVPVMQVTYKWLQLNVLEQAQL